MAITTIEGTRVQHATESRSIVQVEVTYEPTRPGEEARHRAWEFHCETCDEACYGLTEGEARDELETHECMILIEDA